MRVAVLSDLHIDIDHNAWRDPPPRIDADVVVVIGDTTNPMTSGLQWLAEHIVGPPRLIYVPGNHCFYRGAQGSGEENTYYEDQMSRGREMAASLGFDLLQNDLVEIDGARFAGSTGWTDFSLLPEGWSRKMAMFYSQNGRLPSNEGYNSGRDRHHDYTEIRRGGGNSKHRFTPSQSLELHRESFAFFERTLSQPFDGPTVCISHMGPASSVADRGMHSWLYGSTDIESLMTGPTAPDFWLHGHVHRSFDYTIGDGGPRVVCNPRGYPGERGGPRENPDFDPTLTIEVGRDLTPVSQMGM